MKFKSNLLVLFIALFAFSCTKEGEKPDPNPPGKSRADLTRDSIFLYAKELYYWNTALPSIETFNVSRFKGASTDLDNYNNELIALTQIPINPATGKPYEYVLTGSGAVDSKFSYISDLANKNPTAYIFDKQAAVDLDGNGNDFGIKLQAYAQDAQGITYALFMNAVYPGSPADKAGMVRSNRIYKVNGRTIGDNYANDRNFINEAFNGNTITIEGVKYTGGAAGAPYTVTLIKAVYKSSPILKTRVFTVDDKKIGYLALARFSTLSAARAEIDETFTKFADSNVKDLIIDLRYNGGGYVNTAEYIINKIAPSSANGKVMFAEHYNTMMQNKEAEILLNQPYRDADGKVVFQNGKMITYFDFDYSIPGNTEVFVKSGPFNAASDVGKVVFIVSGATASASELLINALKPFMTVKLIGEKTYGKPVGFFPIRIENKYEVYYAMFSTKNSLGAGDYYDGFAPDIFDDFDDPRNNFGDPSENYIAKAIKEIKPNANVIMKANKTMSIKGQEVPISTLKELPTDVGNKEFKGMVKTDFKIK